MIKNVQFLSILFLLMTISTSLANENTNDEYFNKAVKVFEEKCKGTNNSDFLKCLAEYTPKKCKELAFGRDRLAWKDCISSCKNANLYSKNFGECSN